MNKGGRTGQEGRRSGTQGRLCRKSQHLRAESKGAKILAMIRRPQCATLAEIMQATDRRAHSVPGFISTAVKKHGITIESAKNDAGDRVYKTAK
jgi:Protein of unknown function (DUF3489)